MRMQITVDDSTKEVVDRLSRVTGISQSCIFSFGITQICYRINSDDDNLFDDLADYYHGFYSRKNSHYRRSQCVDVEDAVVSDVPRQSTSHEVDTVCKGCNEPCWECDKL